MITAYPKAEIDITTKLVQKISAIIDWGDLTEGDVANDLACLWMLFESKIARQNALQRYGANDGLIKRSMGWAVFFAVIFLGIAEAVSPVYAKIGKFIVKNLMED
jgi:aminoglycoside phosphotransferase (APT) family kinase protein